MKPCGDMHKGGDTGLTNTCPHCLKASELPTYNALVVDLAHERLKNERQAGFITYLQAQLRQCRGAGEELKLAEIKLAQRVPGSCAWCGKVHNSGVQDGK